MRFSFFFVNHSVKSEWIFNISPDWRETGGIMTSEPFHQMKALNFTFACRQKSEVTQMVKDYRS